MNYVYEGPGPVVDPDGGLIHPGDVRDFGEEPDCPPWRPLGDALREASAVVPEAPPPPPAATPATTPAAGTEGGM